MRGPDAKPIMMPPHLNEWDEKHYFWYPVKFCIGAGHYGTCNPDLVDCWDRSLHDVINMKDWFADLETGNISNRILTRKQMELKLFAAYGDHHNPGKQSNLINCWKTQLSTEQLQAWELYRHKVHDQELEFYRWEFFRNSTHYVAATPEQRLRREEFAIERIEDQMACRDEFIYTIVSVCPPNILTERTVLQHEKMALEREPGLIEMMCRSVNYEMATRPYLDLDMEIYLIPSAEKEAQKREAEAKLAADEATKAQEAMDTQ